MASSKDYLQFVLEQLSELQEITYRAMMGEFIIYYRGKIVGGIYDDRLLVKPTKSAISYMPTVTYEFLHISPDLSNSLDRKHQYPDAKSNIFDKIQLIAFTVPQNPRKTAVSQTGTSLAITMGRRSTDRRIYVSLFE